MSAADRDVSKVAQPKSTPCALVPNKGNRYRGIMTEAGGPRQISADEWRQIVDSAVETAIITTDLEGRLTSWNEGACRILGWSAAEVLGETLERLFPAGEGAAALERERSDALSVGRG